MMATSSAEKWHLQQECYCDNANLKPLIYLIIMSSEILERNELHNKSTNHASCDITQQEYYHIGEVNKHIV